VNFIFRSALFYVALSVAGCAVGFSRTALLIATARAEPAKHIQSVLEVLRAEPSQFLNLHKTAFEFVRAIGRLYDAYRVIGPDFCFQ
jgi:hypothetical protein